MKKTAQIVTVPLNKEGWNKGDIVEFITNSLKRDVVIAKVDCFDEFSISISPNYKNLQLLVLSDDEVKEEDWYTLIIADKGVVGRKLFKCHERPIDPDNATKVIASYPQIEGTLPISKETVQAWIDAGTPEECSVDKHEWSTVLNDSITIKHLVKNNWKLVKSELPKPPFDDALMYYYERNTLDPQGNLLLEFPEQQTIEDIRSGYLSVEWIKPSIPTDEKINDIASDYAVEKCRIMKNMKCLTARKTAYIDGYRQALKDLGHE